MRYFSTFLSIFIFGSIGSRVFSANNEITLKNNAINNQQNINTLKLEKPKNKENYILGAGDKIEIEVWELPELSRTVEIGPDGSIYLPRLREVYIEGLTIKQVSLLLQNEFKKYIKSPVIYTRIISYRPIRVYVSGSVNRPGYYTISGSKEYNEGTDYETTNLFPKLFDAIARAEGITPYADLSKVEIIRRLPSNYGNQKLKANINFISTILNGDDTQNIRIFDGDSIHIKRTKEMLPKQLLKAGQTNLNPRYLTVFMSGDFQSRGQIDLPQGSYLNQAISLAVLGPLNNQIEIVRFTYDGELETKKVKYTPNAKANSKHNPILLSGDIIRTKDSIVNKGIKITEKFTSPLIGISSLFYLLDR